MENVIGLGGLFLKAADPQALCQWYDQYLGTEFNGNTFMTLNGADGTAGGTEKAVTVFSFFKNESAYFQPSDKGCMINFRVKNLEAMLAQLREAGVWVDEKTETYDYGKFGWCMDIEGNKIELWEPGVNTL